MAVKRNLLTIGLFALVLLVIDAGYVAYRIAGGLPEAAERLEAGMDLLRGGEAAEANRHFGNAVDQADSAVRSTRHPAFLISAAMPILGSDARAVSALARSVEKAALAAQSGGRVVAELGGDPSAVADSIYRDGKVLLDQLRILSSGLTRVEALIVEAEKELSGAPQPHFDSISDRVELAKEKLSEQRRVAQRAARFVEVVPGFLGGKGSREYLLVFQALSEARGTGGVAGLYGVVAAEDGRLDLLEIGPYDEAVPKFVPPVEAPKWFRENYSPQFATRQWPQANLSPNFPVTAEVFLNMYEAGTGRALDGVIALDPLALEQLMRGTEPVVTRGLGKVDSANVADKLLRDSYLLPTRRIQTLALEQLVREFWALLRSGDIEAPVLMEALAESAEGGHLKLYSRAPVEQATMSELGAGGDFSRFGPAVQMVFNNNYSVNKVDYYLYRETETRVQLGVRVPASVTVRQKLQNRAPSGPPSDLLGPGRPNDPAGLNRMVLGFLVPQGSRVHSFKATTGPPPEFPFVYMDSGHPVTWDTLELPSGSSAIATVRYFMSESSELTEDGGRFELTLYPQTSINPESFSVAISLPQGFRMVAPEEGSIAKGGGYELSGTLTQPVTVALEVVPVD